MSARNSYSLLQSLGFQGSIQEALIILSLTGGVLWYIELFNPKLSAAENIKRLCFTRDGTLVKEYNKIFYDLFGKRGDIYRRIVGALAAGPKEYSEISEAINYPSGGPLSGYLEELVISGFIRRDYSWNFNSGKNIDVSQYRLYDNYLRFYTSSVSFSRFSSSLSQVKKISNGTKNF